MNTNTHQYEASHGHKPQGDGVWWFDLTFTDGQGRFGSAVVSAPGTLAQARKLAWKNVQSTVGEARKLVEVTVLP